MDVKGVVRVARSVEEGGVDFADDVALEAADDLFLGEALFGAAFDVGAGAGVVAHVGTGRWCRGRCWRLRSPPRLRRCRSVRPELAGMGATPQRWAKRGFAAEPVGVVAGGGEQLPGDLGADAEQGDQAWARCVATSGREPLSAWAISAVSAWTRPAMARSAAAGGLDRVGAGGSRRRRRSAHRRDQLRPGQAASAAARSCSGAETIRPWSWLSAAVRAWTAPRAGHPQRTDRLDRAGAGLRGAAGLAGQRRPGGGDRVDRVGLALAPAGLAVGPVDLDHLDAARSAGTGPARRRSAPVPSTPTLTTRPNRRSQASSCLVAGRRWPGTRLSPSSPPDLVDRPRRDGSCRACRRHP